MNITYKYDNSRASIVANQIAQARGYEGYAFIDDPILREWIWDRSVNYVRESVHITLSFSEFLTTVLIVLAVGLLIGILL